MPSHFCRELPGWKMLCPTDQYWTVCICGFISQDRVVSSVVNNEWIGIDVEESGCSLI